MNTTMKITISIIAILGISLLLYAGATILQDEDTDTDNTNINDNTQNDTNTWILAIVNGEEISSEMVNSTQQTYIQQGQQFSQKSILELLINQTVVLQNAVTDGYNYTDDEVESEIQKLLAQQNSTLDMYKQQLQIQGLSYEQGLQDYKEQLMLQDYLYDAIEGVDLNVSDADAMTYYESYKNQTGGELASYEELESQIIDYLKIVKEQKAISNVIKDLRKDAEIIYL